MSDQKAGPGTSTTTSTATAEAASTHAEVADQLMAEATKAQARHDQDDARADEWGMASFPASDPPQNY
ncbi:hypothetical protein GCM10010977_31310 [Citricoccus zhacaiensis]|uniref:Uncharacterized protein n=1 Tax=Citricoccus zhacaiensis TaxID=489142 RepID=A0ABQ2MBM8_9MICC|nr:hypothetical protein [Citricoccus zhacaiensis]GGO49438.1 hypothetical protein GCM10010977_31310 [Citricoccus zhacaiensis]